jgi:cell division protein FtsB
MKKLLYFGVVIICILIINNLLHSIYDLWHKQDLVVSAQKNLDMQKEENRKLKLRLKLVDSDKFIEEEARDKLLMVKPGESGIILPEVGPKTEKKEAKIPNWQLWLRLIF